jgi:Predicted membrane protein
LWWAPLRPGGSWLALKVLPLLAAAPGMWRGRLYTYQWMSMLVWFYLTEGVVRGLTDPQALSRTLGWVECALALAAFGMMAATLRAHAGRPRMQAQPDASGGARTAMPADALALRPTDASAAAVPNAVSDPRP